MRSWPWVDRVLTCIISYLYKYSYSPFLVSLYEIPFEKEMVFFFFQAKARFYQNTPSLYYLDLLFRANPLSLISDPIKLHRKISFLRSIHPGKDI